MSGACWRVDGAIQKVLSYTADLRANFTGRKSWYDAVYKYMTTQHLDRSNKIKQTIFVRS